jgi:hypothetical protein
VTRGSRDHQVRHNNDSPAAQRLGIHPWRQNLPDVRQDLFSQRWTSQIFWAPPYRIRQIISLKDMDKIVIAPILLTIKYYSFPFKCLDKIHGKDKFERLL